LDIIRLDFELLLGYFLGKKERGKFRGFRSFIKEQEHLNPNFIWMHENNLYQILGFALLENLCLLVPLNKNIK